MTKELSAEEANEVCLKFLGFEFKKTPIAAHKCWVNKEEDVYLDVPRFHKDLNLLVPIWEKGKDIFDGQEFCRLGDGLWTASILIWVSDNYYDAIRYEATAATIQEAACIATAKAILESEGREE